MGILGLTGGGNLGRSRLVLPDVSSMHVQFMKNV